jgi:hypothetical protein
LFPVVWGLLVRYWGRRVSTIVDKCMFSHVIPTLNLVGMQLRGPPKIFGGTQFPLQWRQRHLGGTENMTGSLLGVSVWI